MVGYNGKLIRAYNESIHEEITANADLFGMKVESDFNPYAEQNFNRAGSNKLTTVNPDYDHTLIDQQIKDELVLQKQLLEREVTDRDIKVFSSSLSPSDLREKLSEIDEMQ